jgi:hypothetical protein
MTTNAYIISWDMTGLEAVVPITQYEQWDRDNTFRILKDEPTARNPLNNIVQGMLLRARFNSQRHYEIYTIDCVEEISESDIRHMFETNPQASADLIRDRGHRLYSDRVNRHQVAIL